MSELPCTSDVGYRALVQAASGFRCVPESPALRSFLSRTRVQYRSLGSSGMADDAVVAERGVVTASAQAWDLAARRADVIRGLAAQRVVSLEDADAAAARLGVSRRQVYVLVGRWRSGEGLVSDLLPGTSSGGRGGGRLPDQVEAVVREVLQTRYLTRQRRPVASICREIARECKVRGLRAPSRGAVLHRIALLDPARATSAREGPDAARALRSATCP